MEAMRRFVVLVALGIGMAFVPSAFGADAFPGNPSGTEIGGGLPSGYEPSGVIHLESSGKLYPVSDDGWVSEINTDGSGATTWYLSGDYEGITVADEASDYVYIGIESPDSIREFDVSTGSLTGKSWDLTSWMTGPSNQGLEALAFVPNGSHPYSDSNSGGLFYAGLQQDGKIYIFDVDLSTSGTVSYVDTITPVSGRADLSGLFFNEDTGVLYAIFDAYNLLRAMDGSGTYLAEWDLPGSSQEGICIEGDELFIAQDSGDVWKYSFPGDVSDADLNVEGNVDTDDIAILVASSNWGESVPENPRSDIDGSAIVDAGDLGAMMSAWD